jgi:hypothetical protein
MPAPADAPPTLAFIPIPHCFSQHLDFSFGHDSHPSQQHPDALPTMATAITTIIELTFMDYLTFIYLLSPRNPFPVRRRNDTSFSTATQSGIIGFCWNYNKSKKFYLGPTLPAFLSPNVTNLLGSKFGIAGIGTVDDDIKLLG